MFMAMDARGAEYGEPDSITYESAHFKCDLRFPKTGSKAADEVIFEWASGLYNSMSGDVSEMLAEDKGATAELTSEYSVRMVDGGYAVVEETGMFTASSLAHPFDIVQIFNIDTKRGKVLGVWEIIDKKQAPRVLAALRGKILKKFPEEKDSLGDWQLGWLDNDNIALDNKGIYVWFDRGRVLASVFGTQKFFLSRKELGGAFILK
ncbi:hypothetical protein FACS1894167_12890 [Synergistales bacterium]|nr:hypothetical protein FACS1894167_12890 [Synergistales bacterium]GHV52735.1 hypothetical protein FACS1894216_09410 [Synergistales bacterium]